MPPGKPSLMESSSKFQAKSGTPRHSNMQPQGIGSAPPAMPMGHKTKPIQRQVCRIRWHSEFALYFESLDPMQGMCASPDRRDFAGQGTPTADCVNSAEPAKPG